MRIIVKSLQMLGGTIAAAALLATATGCHSTGRTTGEAINDKMTAFDVNRALGSDPVLKFPDVKVHVYEGNAQLSGFVNSEEQRNRAAEIAAGVKGVSQVINEISIKPTPTGRATIRDPLHGNDRNLSAPPNENPPPPPR